ncbi:MAG: glycoside hydrolase family 31 protein [Clostridia bacterium]|nr:glycoside hydrolase family 31 protein [Clostridia bacterium]
MKGFLWNENGTLRYFYDSETVCISAYGKNGLRVRATPNTTFKTEVYGLPAREDSTTEIEITENGAWIRNGKLTARLNENGNITFLNRDGAVLFEEYERSAPLNLKARDFHPIPAGKYRLTARFCTDPQEKLYGMGQYQQDVFDLKGSVLELAHRNTQASVPFLLSDKGYGFLWNNPAIGEAVLGKNMTLWRADVSEELDYLVIAGDTPKEIVEAYMDSVGHAPVMPDYALGFWQSRLRYRTQEELLSVARKYKELGIPLSVIVVDYYFFPADGDWRFDEKFWPDPNGMIRELEEMGTKVMVSTWPAVDPKSENFAEITARGYLVRNDRGKRDHTPMGRPLSIIDVTNPDAMAFMWQKLKENFHDKGIRIFWLDCAEPELYRSEFDMYRYAIGTHTEVGNLYPMLFEKGIYDGMRAAGQREVLNLARCAWIGSQRYGALVWSGDVSSTFAAFRTQVVAGLQMSIAGIPWWTTDIGGFSGGNIHDEAFRELLIRWFEYGTFSPVMRLHGTRLPHIHAQEESSKGVKCGSGAENEIWSYGEDAFEIMKTHILYREEMRPYLKETMRKTHENGTPPMRPLFYDFPNDKNAWEIADEYLFGDALLVCPVLEYGARSRKVYLPEGADWIDAYTKERFAGGTTVDADAPIERIPVFVREKR